MNECYKLYRERNFTQCVELLVQVEQQGATCDMLVLHGLCERQLFRITDSLVQFKRAQELSPLDIRPKIELARSLYLTGQFEECLEYTMLTMEQELAASTSIHALYWLRGCCLERLGHLQESLSPLFRAYELFPNFSTKQRIASIQHELGCNPDCVETLQDVLQFSPQNAEVLVKLGSILFEENLFDQAFDAFSRAVFVASKQLQQKTSQLHQVHQKAFFGLGCLLQGDELQASLQKYRVVGSQLNAGLWHNLSDLFLQMNRIQAAVVCARRAFQLQNSQEMRYQLGLCYVRGKDYLRGFHVLSFFSSSKDTEPRWLLGICAAKLKEVKVAYSCLLYAAEASFSAAVCGLQLAAEQRDFEMCSKFSKFLKQNEPENDNVKKQAKELVKWVKSQIKGEEEVVEEQQIDEQNLQSEQKQTEPVQNTTKTKTVEKEMINREQVVDQEENEEVCEEEYFEGSDQFQRSQEYVHPEYQEEPQNSKPSVKYSNDVRDQIMEEMKKDGSYEQEQLELFEQAKREKINEDQLLQNIEELQQQTNNNADDARKQIEKVLL
ncbi:Tetratricopeptide_repeat-containing protein [Hexamita inflata]|uniref:Tetratricopeptide_repeat-containing protein n=1 Tax=Hexamita inflata TaxID=28002 RepID=A0ABP1IKL0_9EUKA